MGDAPQVVCADWAGTVWTWDPLRDVWSKPSLTCAFAEDPAAAAYPDAGNEIHSVAVAVFDGRLVLAAGGYEQPAAIWDLDSGELLRATTYVEPYVYSIATVKGENPPRFAIETDVDIEVLGLPADAAPVVLPDVGGGLAAARIDGRSLIVSVNAGVWDLAGGEQLTSLDGAGGLGASAVAVSRIDDRPIIVTGTDAGAVYVWELFGDDSDEPIRSPLTRHEGHILALDTAVVGDRPLAVTGGRDETLRIWDLADGTGVGAPLVGHRGSVKAVETTTLRGRHVVLSGGEDDVIRVWDLAVLLR